MTGTPGDETGRGQADSSRDRSPTRRVVLGLAATVGLAAGVGLPPRQTATAAGGLQLTVGGDASGFSTRWLGACEGNTGFDVAQLKDIGVNAYRVYGGIGRYEPADDGGGYGSPTIDQIRSDPNSVPWQVWDAVMSDPPRGSDYSWSTTSNAIWQGNARTLFQALRDNGIRPVVTLRAADNVDASPWLANPPTTDADWNEWWEHVFAMVWWFNVRNDYGVDDWEINNEPDNYSQGWHGTEAQYLDFVRYTSDAIRHVYDTYLPGRTANIHAPATVGGSTWPRDLLDRVSDQFTTLNVHDYDASIDPYVRQVRGWSVDAGRGRDPLWLGEWGTYTGGYDDRGFSVTVVQNVQRGSTPGPGHVDGSLIFSLYDWVGDKAEDVFHGLIGADGHLTWSYYAFRMAARALQGAQATYPVTGGVDGLLVTATTSQAGTSSVLVTNSTGSDQSVTVDLSSLGSFDSVELYRLDADHADDRDGRLDVSGGTFTALVPADGVLLARAGNRVLFRDTFETSAATAWTTHGGTWSVTTPAGNSREYAQQDVADALALAAGDWADARTQAYVNISSGSAAVVVRAADPDHFYQLELKTDAGGTPKWWIWRNDGGTFVELASGGYDYRPGSYYLLRIDARARALTAAVSADYGATFTTLGSATDSRYPAGAAGLRTAAGSARFDEVTVTVLT